MNPTAPPAASSPWKRVLRNDVTTTISVAAATQIVIPLIEQALTGHGIPAPITADIDIAGGAVVVVGGAITRIIAIPAVNAFLAKIGLGSAPAPVIAAAKRGKNVSL